ncbi:transcriptional regulator [Arenibaculum pallidiluteum]|uniref:transcriptional regulator n=1 Tax=Arenibaculum pallidiluteum TaxID=2812559 RepID=UPI001F1F06AD|nr:transcriptional regulator [Arenibaculum pallidiluteum]
MPSRRPRPNPDQFDLLDIPEPTAVMLTYSGRTVDLANPDFGPFEIEDIARPLAYQCRFVGNTIAFFSVAQHCVLASRLVAEEYAYDALMHDCEEAFTGDWPTPWKVRIGRPAIQAAVEPLKKALAARFRLRYPQPDAVKTADLRALATELRDLCAPHRLNWRDLPPPDPEPIRPLAPDEAMEDFLARYRELAPVPPARPRPRPSRRHARPPAGESGNESGPAA